MKLYWARLSPFVRKVMIVAHETGTADRIALVETSVAMSEANAQLQPDNPLSKIPTLRLDDGTSLYDSRTICEYLDSLHDGAKLFPEGPGRWDALRRQSLADGMMDALILWRQERMKPDERSTLSWMVTFGRKIGAALAQLDADAGRLSDLPFDIGHAALGSALRYMDVRFEDLAWRDKAPALAAWHAAFEQRPSALATDPLA